jgi:geranylgeranyl diphosphate synthase, type I
VSKETLLPLVQRRLDDYCELQREALKEISEDIVSLIDYTQDFLEGGKRFRAQFCYWAWASLAHSRVETADLNDEAEGIVGIAAALEMFHAAALVHDDLLDQSDTRRGKPAIHKRFESQHQRLGFAGEAVRFGVAGSVLVGDLMLAWSSELFGDAMRHAANPEVDRVCREEFSRMRFEVMAGQFLDVLEENAAPIRSLDEIVVRANRIMLYKTAKYSLEAPLMIGAAFAGANPDQLRAFSNFGIPLGMAFQLRDDVLGVFGDPEITGKPAGDDLREGKRTVLVGLTLQSLPTGVAKIFEELLTAREIDDEQVSFMQQAIIESGARSLVEKMIAEYSESALAALAALEISELGRERLGQLTEAVINRAK